MRLAVFVPAKKTSIRLPRKNLRDGGRGPLTAAAVQLAADACMTVGVQADIYVITDSKEIGWAAEAAGAVAVAHPPYDRSTRVGDAVAAAARRVGWTGPTLILQPTCATLSVETLAQALAEWEARFHTSDRWETVIGVTDDSHIRWDATGIISPRTNALPKNWKETGWFLTSSWPAAGSNDDAPHIGYPAHLWETPTAEAIDVNDELDLAAARKINSQRSILITVSGQASSGTGHVRRQLALADQLDHRVAFDGRAELDSWAEELIGDAGHRIDRDPKGYDLQVIDVADPWLPDIVGCPCGHVSFEDLGEVSNGARLVVNSLYYDPRPNALSGPRWEVLPSHWTIAPQQVKDRKWVTVTFGGTDPEGASAEVARAVSTVYEHVRLIAPPFGGRPDFDGEVIVNPFMPAVLAESKLVISSAGRTVIECAAVGTPALVFPVNEREQRHILPSNVLGSSAMWATDERITARAVRWALDRPELLERLSLAGRRDVDGKAGRRVAHHIDGLFI